jgi:hypothetical protein
MLSHDDALRVFAPPVRTEPEGQCPIAWPGRKAEFACHHVEGILLQRDPSSPNPADPLSNPGTDPDHGPQDLPGGKPVDAPRPENEGMPQNPPSPDQQHPLGPPEPIERANWAERIRRRHVVLVRPSGAGWILREARPYGENAFRRSLAPAPRARRRTGPGIHMGQAGARIASCRDRRRSSVR